MNIAKYIIIIMVIIMSISACGRQKTSSTDVKLEQSDKLIIDKILFYGLNNAGSEAKLEWYNDETGNAGAIIFDASRLNKQGLYCRYFREEVEIPLGAIPNWFYGRACRNKNGIWVRQ